MRRETYRWESWGAGSRDAVSCPRAPLLSLLYIMCMKRRERPKAVQPAVCARRVQNLVLKPHAW